MLRGMFKKIEEFRILKQANPEAKKIHKYTVSGFMLPFKWRIKHRYPGITVAVPNNEPIRVVADATELMSSFYVRYVNWTLNHEESPPREHSPVRNSPPVVASPRRRNMYKSETCSTESDTNASSSQPPEIERTYMSSDTSTKVVKKKKTSTKTLVKRIVGVVADLSFKVDRVLQKKDEPNTRFVKEVEDEMINEDEEDAY
ncbi:unnamed protein product [Lactuca saligna]|uniref:Uncharacterized protein n=1 Tax=Lactuca saligna TaxID=75948 RepID=A0AA35ZXS9_LACSI|nr:unnamed protein product [Lactuca saligna]